MVSESITLEETEMNLFQHFLADEFAEAAKDARGRPLTCFDQSVRNA